MFMVLTITSIVSHLDHGIVREVDHLESGEDEGSGGDCVQLGIVVVVMNIMVALVAIITMMVVMTMVLMAVLNISINIMMFTCLLHQQQWNL